MAVSSKKLICWAVAGIIMAGVGIVFVTVGDVVILSVMEKEAILVPGAFGYTIWLDIPIPIYFQFWIWNITNPEEFLNGGPARLVEMGPYSYREYRPKINITHHDNGTVSYMNWKTFEFAPEKSIGPESDMCFTINAPAFTVASWLRNSPDDLQYAWELLHELSNATLILQLSVKDLIRGYSDKYLELAQKLLGKDRVPSTMFGFILAFNDSDDGVWSMHTGEKDIMMINQVDLWNHNKLLPYWTTDYANMLNGTDGTIFHPLLDKNEQLYTFTTYICRSGFLEFDSQRQLNGVWLYRYVTPWYLYAHPSLYPTNIDFCTPDQTTCPPTGLINGSECFFKAPVYVSQPHFLYGDKILFESVIGMNPDKEMHELSADIDPLTGITFRGNLRAQVNLKIGPYDYIPGTERIREMYLPIVWLNESATMPDEYTTKYNNYIQIPQWVIFSLAVVLISAGGGILIGLVNFLLWRAWKGKKESSHEIEMDVKPIPIDD